LLAWLSSSVGPDPLFDAFRNGLRDLQYIEGRLDLQRRAASYVDRLLRGLKPDELPVEQASKFELIVNLTTAKAIGVTVPQSVLFRATEVVE
jgi:ABC transporter substrate binding protein